MNTSSPELFIESSQLLSIQNHLSDTTPTNTASVDAASKGFAFALCVFQNSLVLGADQAVITLQESDDDTTFTDIAGASYTLLAADQLTTKYALVRLRGKKRYIRFQYTCTNNGGGAAAFGLSLQMLAAQYPSDQSATYLFNVA